MADLSKIINDAVVASGADESISSQLILALKKELEGYVSLELLKTKLAVLYEYEKNYLELVNVLVNPNWTLLLENFQTLPVTDRH